MSSSKIAGEELQLFAHCQELNRASQFVCSGVVGGSAQKTFGAKNPFEPKQTPIQQKILPLGSWLTALSASRFIADRFIS
ncbi:MAG: hypothetical protein WA400_10095 [Silvibacterium sp.]